MSTKKYLIIGMVGIALSFLLGIHKNFYNGSKHVLLQTAMDIEAVNNSDAVTGDALIDTVTQEVSQPESNEQNIDAHKREEVIALVEDALVYIQNNPFDTAMSDFTHGRDFIRGEIYLFVYDFNGFEYANGQDERMIWKNLIDLRDPFGTYIIRELIRQAKEGGGWTTYNWRNATKNSYVKPFIKNNREYLVGAGYYPHSPRDIVVGLVRAAVAYFNEVVNEKGFLVDEVFSTLSYPAGRFVMGDLYLYAVDFTGRMMANGDRPGLIGTNVLNVKDSDGKFVNQEIIKALKNSAEGVWIAYQSKNAKKLTYAQKVTDKEGKEYFIASGFYPQVTPTKVVDLVKDGYEFMKSHGLSASVAEFSNRQADTYRFGDLYLVVWDMKGKVMAHGSNLDALGISQFDLRDEDGRYFVQDIIAKAKTGGGWVDFKLKNAFQSMYSEKVELGTDDFVIGSGFYPISHHETALLLVRSAAGFLRTHSLPEAFNAFSDNNGKFVRGDLFVFVVDFDGYCKVWGDEYELIGRNILNAKDDTGKPYIQIFINTVKQGSGQVTYRINGKEKVALLELVEKDGKSYVVGTAYYL